MEEGLRGSKGEREDGIRSSLKRGDHPSCPGLLSHLHPLLHPRKDKLGRDEYLGPAYQRIMGSLGSPSLEGKVGQGLAQMTRGWGDGCGKVGWLSKISDFKKNTL